LSAQASFRYGSRDTTCIGSVPRQLLPLLPLESRLLEALCDAAMRAGHDIAISGAPSHYRHVRAGFLRWFLLHAIPAIRPPITELLLQRAIIVERLDLCGGRLACHAIFRHCEFTGPIDLREARVRSFEVIAGSVPAIWADRLTARGSLRFCAAVPQRGYRAPVKVAGAIRLNGAHVHGNLDLEGAELGAELAEQRGYLPPVDIPPIHRVHDAASPAGRAEAHAAGEPDRPDHRAWIAVEADGLTVDGNLRCVWPFRARGELRFDGCRIARNLDCSGACLENFGGHTLSAAGARIAGTVYLGSPFREDNDNANARFNPRFISRGTVRIDGARIEGDLDCSDGQFYATAFLPDWDLAAAFPQDPYALRAKGVEVSANILLGDGFEAHGNVTFLNARVGRDFDCRGEARFDFPGGEALCCDGISVAGVMFLRGTEKVLSTNGVLRFILADIRQGFYVRNVSFDRSVSPAPLLAAYPEFRAPNELGAAGRDWNAACGIYAPDASMAGSFIWKQIVRLPADTGGNYPLWLHVAGSRTDTVDDDISSWQALDRFDVTNCQYRSVADLSEESRSEKTLRQSVDDRLHVLDCEYAPHAVRKRSRRRQYDQFTRKEATHRFKPQPYLQFARVLRAAGLDKEADDVIVRLESHRTWYGDIPVLRRVGRLMFFGGLLRYGFGRGRPLIAIALCACLSTIVFQAAYRHEHIRPTWHNRQDLARVAEQTPPVVQFNAVVFALDTLIPLVDLNQKDNWEAEPLSTPEGSAFRPAISWYRLGRYYDELLDDPTRAAALLVMFNKVFGWLLTTLFAGAFTGVLRGGRETPELPGSE
jgi:hypothetical protein